MVRGRVGRKRDRERQRERERERETNRRKRRERERESVERRVVVTLIRDNKTGSFSSNQIDNQLSHVKVEGSISVLRTIPTTSFISFLAVSSNALGISPLRFPCQSFC